MSFAEYIAEDAQINKRQNKKYCFSKFITREHDHIIWKYQLLLRKEEYYSQKGSRILALIYRRKKNKLGERLGFTIPKGVFGSGLKIWHYGNIVVSAQAKVGKYCILHGDNCIGNKGIGSMGVAPVIGDYVDIGVGAKILGDITIANHVTIAAGAVVISSCKEENIILAGVPAHVIRHGKLLDEKSKQYE